MNAEQKAIVQQLVDALVFFGTHGIPSEGTAKALTDGWALLAEPVSATPAEAVAQDERRACVQAALAGINYFLLVKEERRFIEGAREELRAALGTAPPAVSDSPLLVFATECAFGAYRPGYETVRAARAALGASMAGTTPAGDKP